MNDQQAKEEIINITKIIQYNHLVQGVVRPTIKPIRIYYNNGKKCLKCGRIGHLTKYCKTKPDNINENHRVRKLHYISDKKDEQQNLHQLYPTTIGSTTVDLLMDSGSTLNILHEVIFKKLQPKPRLNESKINIRTYQGNDKLKVKGRFKACIKPAGKQIISNIFVL